MNFKVIFEILAATELELIIYKFIEQFKFVFIFILPIFIFEKSSIVITFD